MLYNAITYQTLCVLIRARVCVFVCVRVVMYLCIMCYIAQLLVSGVCTSVCIVKEEVSVHYVIQCVAL